MAVLGVDACRAGWVGVLLGAGRVVGVFGMDLPQLLVACERTGIKPHVLAIDMPIGLPDQSDRQADVLARRFVGPRASSVFPTPVRAVLSADSYAVACEVSRGLTGKAISQQAFALLPRLVEVDERVRHLGVAVIEVHPEVTFAQIAGVPLVHAKRTAAGQAHRRQLLESHGIAIDADLLGLGRVAKPDDVLDAAAAAWTAQRYLEARAVPLPDPPEVFSDGWPSAIWR